MRCIITNDTVGGGLEKLGEGWKVGKVGKIGKVGFSKGGRITKLSFYYI